MPRIDLCCEFDESLKSHLRKIKVHSVLDFINGDPEKLTSSTLCAKDYFSLKHKLISQSSKHLESGLKRYETCLKKAAVLPTRIKCVDEMLNGGLETGCVYEITGLSGSGKTQFCMSIVASVISNLKRKVFYFDSKNDFRAERIHGILSEKGYSDGDINSFFEKVHVIRVPDMYDIINELYNIRENLQQNSKSEFRLLVLDSLTAPFLEFIGSQSSNEGFGLLMEIGSALKQLAREMHLTVIVTNLAVRYSIFDGDSCLGDGDHVGDSKIRPAMGKPWAQVPHTRLLLQNTSESDSITLSILKSNLHPLNKSTTIKISSQGVT